MNRKTALPLLISAVLAGTAGCKDSETPKPTADPNAPIVKIDSFEDHKEVPITGRTYSPGFTIDKKVNVSYGTPLLNDAHHDHDIPINLVQPDRFYLHLGINGRTIIYQVTPEQFRDAKESAMVKYVEKRKSTFKANVPESERLSEEFSGIEVIGFELKN
jgi:hypothetical protein